MKTSPLIIRLIVLAVLLALIPWGFATANSLFQQPAPARDPETIRELYLQGDVEKLWHPTTTPPDQPFLTNSPAGSPPFWAHLVFQSYRGYDWDLHTLEPDGLEKELESGGGSNWYPALSKNGLQIAFINNFSGNWEIFTIGYDGENLSQLTYDPGSDLYPSWSPDGSKIIFQSNRAGNYDLYVMAPNGSGVTPLTSSPAYEGEPSWSPDGKQIVYVSNQTGNYELWVMNQDGSDPHQISFGLNYALAPKWSPKGDRIAFSQDGDNNTFYEVWFIDPEGSNLNPLETNQYFNIDKWGVTWSPDGEWVAYARTVWEYYQGNWYWAFSNLFLIDLNSGEGILASPDDMIWRVDWAASDPLPPTACQVTTSMQTRSRTIPVLFSAQDQGASGILAYDAEVRQPNGNWQTLADWITMDGAVYEGSGLGQVEFRCRAYDRGGNVGPWSQAPILSPNIDAIPPSSSISASENFVKENNVTLSWSGSDPGSGIASFDIFYRDGEDGNWVKWLLNTQNNSATFFNGVKGHTYYFRSQAHDQAGHTQPWQARSHTAVTFYEKLLSVLITDVRGTPVPNATVSLQPIALANESNKTTGLYDFYLGSEITHTLSISATGFDALPPTVLPIAEDTTFQSILPPQNQLIPNSGFESGTLEGWAVAGTGVSATNIAPHTGEFALQFSQVTTPTTTILSQTLSLDPSLPNPTLSFFYHIPTIESGNFEVFVTDAVSPTLSTTILSAVSPIEWTHTWADLTPYSGHSIILTIRFTDGSGIIQLDEISLGTWDEPPIDTHHYLYLPIVFHNASTNNFISADWPMLGYDIARTGYNRGEPGASRYGLEWMATLNSSEVFVSDGILVIENPDTSGIIALDAERGIPLWQYTSNSGGSFTIQHGRVYYDTIDVFLAIDLYTGNQIWANPALPEWEGTIPLVVENRIFSARNDRRDIIALNSITGTQNWGKRYFANLSYHDAMAYHQGVVYAWLDGNFWAFNPNTGNNLWKLMVNTNFILEYGNQIPVITEDLAIMSSGLPKRVYAVNLNTRQVQWSRSISYSIGSWPPDLAVADDTVLVANGELYAYDLISGELQWKFSGDEELSWNPIVTQNYIYVSSSENTYVLDRVTHEVVWQANYGGLLCVANGFLYLASDGKIYAYRAQEP